MTVSVKKDIFISYKNDGCGNQFASRLASDLTELGYSVYFNSMEERGESFPERLKSAIKTCRDFILVLSPGCVEQLKRGNEIDWVREELLTAKENRKHIIPILVDGAKMPGSPDEMPESLRFLPYVDAIDFPEQYKVSPFADLLDGLLSKQDGRDLYKDAYNSNPEYRLDEDFNKIAGLANSGSVEAMYELGLMHFYGATNESGQSRWDFDKAAYWLKKVSASDSPLRFHADNIIARMYYNGAMPREPQSYEKAYQYACRAADNDGYAASQKAFMTSVGLGCEFDYETILSFYKEESTCGDDMSVMLLADFLAKYGR